MPGEFHPYIYTHNGSPVGDDITAINAPKGALVFDQTNGVLYKKISERGSNASYGIVGSDSDTETLTNKTLTTPTIDGVTYSALNDRQLITEYYLVGGASLHSGIIAVATFPAAAMILRCLVNITTVATGACTLDVGYASASATTTSDTLLDGIDANAATGLFDSMNAALDSGANAKAQLAASGKWVTITEKTGDATGLIAGVYVQYILV